MGFQPVLPKTERYYHEIDHATANEKVWGDLVATIKPLTKKCLCEQKSKCLKNAVERLRLATAGKAQLESLRHEATPAGEHRKEAEDWVTANEDQINRELSSAKAELEKCSSAK